MVSMHHRHVLQQKTWHRNHLTLCCRHNFYEGPNWQDVLREALASDNAAIYDDHGELNDEERIEAEAMYNEAHVAGRGGAGEEELDELDAELVDRIRGVKDQAEGRAVHLMELLGRVHETQIKQAATPTPAKGHRPRGLPPMPGTTSSQRGEPCGRGIRQYTGA